MPTLDSVEELANQLSQNDQLALLLRLSSKLNINLPVSTQSKTELSGGDNKGLRLAEQLLAEVEGIPDNTLGPSDLTEEIRQMREERHR